jgi:hypothetical protein
MNKVSTRFLSVAIIILVLVSLFALVSIYGDAPEIPQISYQQSPEIGETIVVHFPYAITEDEALKSFSIYPSIDGELQWLKELNELYFIPLEGFNPAQRYKVTIKKPFSFLNLTQSLIQIGSSADQYAFRPEKLPTKFNARISNEQTIYYITESGLKRPITLDVFYSYPGNREEDIKVTDRQTLNLYPDNTLISFDYDPKVFRLENGVKRHIQNAETFNALGLDWNTIASVSRYELDSYPEGEPLLLKSLPHQKAAEGKFIDINLETMKLTMWENGLIVKELPVAGKGNPAISPTRKGLFTIEMKKEKYFSSLYRVWMPWSMQYSGPYFIHGWPYWPNGQLLTSIYSGGCIRLNTDDAKKVYDFAEVGTFVLIK